MTAASTARTRDREATAERILGAVGEVLARDGFGGVGVNAIAKQAGVDKVLIYRYFGGLPELLTAWGQSGRFWPTIDEITAGDLAGMLALPVAERYALFLERFVDALRARPLTIELLAAELVEPNALTAILEAEREQWGDDVSRLLGGAEFDQRLELRGLTLVLVAGLQFLLVRARHTRLFGGVDITSDAGWSTIKGALRSIAMQLLGQR
jgi:AcrR family transcriptional regulator